MKTSRDKEGHDGNPHLGRFKLLHTHPFSTSSLFLSQGSACQLIEPRKAAEVHKDAQKEIQQVWFPATMNTQAP